MIHDVFAELRENFRAPGLVPGFDLLNVVGSGGQGLVFRARKTAIGRTYVVKFLRPRDLSEPAGFHAAELEHLATLAELRHPHLVAVEDRGEAFDLSYLVLEFAGDRTLRTHLRDEAVTLDDGLRLIGETADGLAYLHARGILHLDVKPSNIFILDGRAKLGDFGLVRIASTTGPIDLTTALGTPPYVAPEVVLRGHASFAADVYGLARVLDDVLIATAARSGIIPPPGLVDLVNAATVDDPARRLPLVEFRARLVDAPSKHLRRVRFGPTTVVTHDPQAASRRPIRFRESGAPG